MHYKFITFKIKNIILIMTRLARIIISTFNLFIIFKLHYAHESIFFESLIIY